MSCVIVSFTTLEKKIIAGWTVLIITNLWDLKCLFLNLKNTSLVYHDEQFAAYYKFGGIYWQIVLVCWKFWMVLLYFVMTRDLILAMRLVNSIEKIHGILITLFSHITLQLLVVRSPTLIGRSLGKSMVLFGERLGVWGPVPEEVTAEQDRPISPRWGQHEEDALGNSSNQNGLSSMEEEEIENTIVRLSRRKSGLKISRANLAFL